jgi:adenine-specific DNA-methyltransferase
MNETTKEIASLQQDNARLRQEIDRLKKSKNKLGLTYKTTAENGEAQKLLQGSIPFLKRVDELSVVKNDNEPNHLLIEGDNISSLTILQQTHREKVDVIYIDPPYNTGHEDFVYNDRFINEDDGFRHSKWLSFMRVRLELAKTLLKDTGVIFISIDDNEQAYLKVLMDRIFGEQNFVEQFIWIKNSGNNNSILTSTKHETIVAFAKDISKLSRDYFSIPKNGYSEVYDLVKKCQKDNVSIADAQVRLRDLYRKNKNNFSKGLFQYKYVDDDYRIFTISDIGNPSNDALNKKEYTYELFDPRTNKKLVMPKRGWLYKKDVMIEKLNHNDIYTASEKPRLKRYLDTVESQNASSIIRDYSNGSDSLRNIFGNIIFDHPKPVSLIRRLLKMYPKRDAIVLDFFAGSGTTGQAVAELNKEDGGTRQAILCTNNFEQDGAENGIARGITAERMRRVLTGKDWADGKEHDALPGNLTYYQVSFRNNESYINDYVENFTASQISGIAALETNVHNVLGAEDFDNELTREFIDSGKIAVLSSSSRIVLVYGDLHTALYFDEKFEEVEQSVKAKSNELGKSFAEYLISYNDDKTSEIDETTTVDNFPIPYVNSIESSVRTLEVKRLLIRPEDSETTENDNDEGAPMNDN